RSDAIHRRKHEQIGHELEASQADVEPDFVEELDAARQDDIGDDSSRSIFTACHPSSSTEARVASTSRSSGGSSTAEIARAFSASESIIAQRIVRAKRSSSEANVPFEVPRGPASPERSPAVSEVVYSIFNEGYTATSGRDWMRPASCDEALRSGRMSAERSAWITGSRREQSNNRGDMAAREQDDKGRAKFNPMIDWTWGDVWHYVSVNHVPYNPSHDQFMPSIGCEPCTRAIAVGEDFRAGRWWWED
ncbi:hypothetical protein OY671_008787, partial [Metschnikowia pulcherrima]